MASIGDILRCTQYFYWEGRQANIVFYGEYIVHGGGEPIATEQEIATSIHEQTATGWWDGLGSHNATLYRTVVDNMTNPSGAFGDYSSGVLGGVLGESTPGFTAMSVKQIVANRRTRAGWKRLPFIAESLINGNLAVIAPAVRAQAEAWFGDFFQIRNPVDDSPMNAWSNVIIPRINVGTPELPVYELDFDNPNPVISATIVGPTTQNSRKT